VTLSTRDTDTPLLQVQRLTVRLPGRAGHVAALQDVSFTVHSGETLGILGSSGSGKTQLLLAIMGLLTRGATASGSIRFDGLELLGLPEPSLDRVRGTRLAMIFQDPMAALNPYLRIATQLVEASVHHRRTPAHVAAEIGIRMLDRLAVPRPRWTASRYPHELSGGMRQRVLIAAALIDGPALLLADEPTTALDPTTQGCILDALDQAKRDSNMAMVLATHDLGVLAALCDRIVVLDQGRVLEEGPIKAVLTAPSHPRTQALVAATPRLDGPTPSAPVSAAQATALVRTETLQVHFLASRYRTNKEQAVRAVDGITLQVGPGETLGIVGESGCGKSTLCRAVAGLVPPTSGRVLWQDRDLMSLRGSRLRRARRQVQMVFQDAQGSLDPHMTVRRSLERQVSRHAGRDAAGVIETVLRLVGADPAWLDRFPHELSGGQCQRIAIARALIPEPAVLVCDEPVSALDNEAQAQIVALLQELQSRLDLGYLFVSHDLAVIRQLSHRVLVLYLGRVIEAARSDALFRHPRHPYTRALLSAVLLADPRMARGRRRDEMTAVPPIAAQRQAGCRFGEHCPLATPLCAKVDPPLRDDGTGHLVACHHA
jgi:peptide/nickel transport system ATP-binding protein